MKTAPFATVSNVMDLLLDAVCVVDREGHFVGVSAACEDIFGYTPEEMIGQPMIELVAPEDRSKTLQAAGEIMAGSHRRGFENRYVRKDGQIVHIMWSARWSEDGQVRVAVARDITARKRSELMQAAIYAISEAAHSTENLSALLQQIHRIIDELIPASHLSVVLHDAANDQLNLAYQTANPAQPGVATGLDALALAAQIIHNGQPLTASPRCQTVQGQHSPAWIGVPLNAGKGRFGALIVQGQTPQAQYTEQDQELLQYISTQVATSVERQQMLNRLRFIAQYDQLTGLPNRALFFDRLHLALARARREQAQLALLFLDLDKFKQINDSFGHSIGDQLLQMVAQRLRSCVRESDTVARLSGDEFVVLLEDIHSAEHVAMVAEKIRLALNLAFDLDGHVQFVLPSIGGALYPQHGSDAQQLLLHADHTMYQAKRNGGNRFQLAPAPAMTSDPA